MKPVHTDDTLNKKVYDKQLLKKLISYLAPYKVFVVISIILLVCVTAVELVVPVISMVAVDNHIVSGSKLVSFKDGDRYKDEFLETAKRFKLETWVRDGSSFVLVPSKKVPYFDKDIYASLVESGKISRHGVFKIYNNEENKKILKDQEYVVRSEELLLISEDIVSVFSGEITLADKDIITIRDYSISKLKLLGILYLILVTVRFLFQYYQVLTINKAAQYAMFDLRKDVFGHLQRMPAKFFDTNPIGRLVTRVTNDIKTLDESLSAGFIQLIQDVLTLLGIIVMMLVLNWKLALIIFTLLPIVYIHLMTFKKKTRVIYRKVRKKLAELNANFAEDISGVKIIQIFNQYKYRAKKISDINDGYFKAGFSQIILFGRFRPLIFIMRFIGTAMILYFGGGAVLKNTLSLGLIFAFTNYLDRFFDPINRLSEKFNILQSALAGAERIFDLMDNDIQDYRDEKTSVDKISGEIKIENLWLSYKDNDEYALKDINIDIKPGEKIALVGHTGSGKTSIVNLITDMYEFQKGKILLDNKNLKDYQLMDIRRNIGIVQQDVFLFSGTIADNIKLDDAEIDQAKMEQVTKYVNIFNFIDSQPGKFNEEVMERGATFSVGQRQLIAFARVLAYNPSIFILDEATSNIDTETELMIQDALEKVMKGRTSIIIAHRLSTIKHVDRIIVLHKGRIKEQGTHDELLQKRGLYYDLYRLQFT